jgi:uncharacterized membrane protein
MTGILPDKNNRLFLALVIAGGCFLRFYHLGFQSFWLDELHTANEASGSWTGLISSLKCCDQHPPLFFFIEKIIIYFFGSSEISLRSVSALAGCLGIWTSYLIGKEASSPRTGLIAAVITAVNPYLIEYAQEARPYAFSFLFSSLSFLYLLRLIKNPVGRNTAGYSAFTLLMLYSHYFGLFALISQIVILVISWFTCADRRKMLLRSILISGLVIAAGFAPWMPILFSIGSIKTFWLQPPEAGFAISYFNEYFGNNDLLKPLLVILLVSGIFHLAKKSEPVYNGSNAFLLLFCFVWIGVTWFIPYLRSLFIVPSLHPRYTILLLPAFIILLSSGISFLESSLLRRFLLLSFCILSLTHFLWVKKYYTTVSKTQFREMAAYIHSKGPFYELPVISEKTAWHQQHYFKKLNYSFPVSGISTLNAIVNDSTAQGFWLTDGHNSPKSGIAIAPQFQRVIEKDFYDAWACLYIRKSSAGRFILVDHSLFPSPAFVLDKDSVIPIWEKMVESEPVALKAGKYSFMLIAKGQPAAGEFPNLNVYIGSKLSGIYTLTNKYDEYIGYFNIPQDTASRVRLMMDNDMVDPGSHEDRNAFVKSVLIVKEQN